MSLPVEATHHGGISQGFTAAARRVMDGTGQANVRVVERQIMGVDPRDLPNHPGTTRAHDVGA